MHMLKQEVADKMTELIGPMQSPRILEIGTGWGESAAHMASVNPGATIYTIDAFGLYGDGRIYSAWEHEEILQVQKGLPKNVIQILGDSSTIPWELPIDVLFIDGDHTEKGCLADWNRFGDWVKKNGIVIFDDYTQENNPDNGVARVLDRIMSDKIHSQQLTIIHKGYYSAILKRI